MPPALRRLISSPAVTAHYQLSAGTQRLLFAFVVVAIALAAGGTPPAHATYDLPNNDADCPGNCRQIPWQAGSDQWNAGSLPVYPSVTCTGLTEGNAATDNGSAIQTCLNNVAANRAALIPPGIYYINRTITVPSNKVLRGSGSANCSQGTWLSSTFPGDTGAGAACTTLKFGANAGIRIGTGATRGGKQNILSGYSKGSTTLTLANASGLTVNDWISVFETGDATIPTTAIGDNGECSWCGENNGSNLIQQFAQVTAIAGSSISLSRPLYYTYSPVGNPGVKPITFSTRRSGIEDIKLNGHVADHGAFIEFEGALFSWAKSVETYNAGSASKANHVNVSWSHGIEIRDSYFHFGRKSSSDKNYGIAFFFWNSDHKVENNILRHHRHSLSFEGGGAGCAILYNYIDDNYTDDLSYLGSARINHGAHPMFNLYEGNSISHLTADDIWGSSSHIVLFRNWLRGGQTGEGVPAAPDWGFYALDVWTLNHYYSAVGNVLGNSTWTSGDRLRVTQSSHCSSSRIAYAYGCGDIFSAKPSSTSINHGNYDFVSDGVAYWEGGADHTLALSMYYAAKPAFFGDCGWPVFGPDVVGLTGTLPAAERYGRRSTCGSVSPPSPPPAPSTLRVN
jgi:hypothetical protein